MSISMSAGSGSAYDAGELALESVGDVSNDSKSAGGGAVLSNLNGSECALFIDGRSSALSRSHGGSCRPAVLRCFYCIYPSVYMTCKLPSDVFAMRALTLSAGTPSMRTPKASSFSSVLLFRLLNDRSMMAILVATK